MRYLLICIRIINGKSISWPSYITGSIELADAVMKKAKEDDSLVTVTLFETDSNRVKNITCYFDENGDPNKDSVIFHFTREPGGKWSK